VKVKIGDKIYDGNKEPVMIILEGNDKKNIANMLPECTKYLCYPKESFKTDEEAYEWMEIEDSVHTGEGV